MNIKKNLFILFFVSQLVGQTLLCSTKVIFSHGIVDSYKQAFWYAKEYVVDGITYYNDHYLFSNFVTFNYPDAFSKLYDNPLWFTETSLGQENEVQRLNLVCSKVTKETENVILFGLSRGASVILNFVGSCNCPEIKALVLESPYDSPATIISNIMKKSGLSYFPHSWGEYVAESIFRKYKRDGIHPSDVLCNIPLTLPILIVCSREDSLVPWTSSYEIYKKLRECGNQNVHIFVADHGKHAKILFDNDNEKYQRVTHAFFKQYNLPHDAYIAANGKNDFALCQPNI